MPFVTHNEELHQLDRTVGVLFLGYVVTMALYGFNAYRMIFPFSFSVTTKMSVQRGLYLFFLVTRRTLSEEDFGK